MSSKLRPGVGIGMFVMSAVVGTMLGNEPAGAASSAGCTGAVCAIPVKVTAGTSAGSCVVNVNAMVGMPASINAVKWTITSPGFEFVPGGNAIAIQNDAGDFSPGSSGATNFELKRSTTAPSGRDYEYKLSIQRQSDKTQCQLPVPTLPRIKNE